MRLSNGHLSDLFFNHRHDNRDVYMMATRANPLERDEDEERAELLKDAQDFAGMIEGAFGVVVTPEEYVSDFYARL